MHKIYIFIVLVFIVGCGDTVKKDIAKDLNDKNTQMSENDDAKVRLPAKLPVNDTSPPVVTLKGSKEVLLNIAQEYKDPGVVAMDDVDGDITPRVQKTSDLNINKAGIYKITYQVSDSFGNKASVERKIIVVDSIAKKKKVFINEFMSSNTRTILDPDFYNFSDWIELYNNTNDTIDIGGYGLSDKTDKIKYMIPPDTKIKPHGYKIFWADKKEYKNHTNFSLNTQGESVVLFDKAGNLIDEIDYQKQSADISMGRDPDTLIIKYMNPTFKNRNQNGLVSLNRVEKPSFSISGGFYDKELTVSINDINADEIYYTLDGSYPHERNGKKYTNAIKIDKTRTLRAVAYKKGKFHSDDMTMTYFIDTQSNLPIVSLSTDEKYLFDDMIGIYTDGENGEPLKRCRGSETENYNYARDWQRPAHIEYFDENRQEEFSFNLDIEITGQCSRHNKKKSFSLSLEDKYGIKYLHYKLFDDKKADKFRSFRLRTGDLGYKLRDILAVALVEDGKLDIDYQAYKAVKMFINGEYWGIYNIREKKGADFIKSNYPDIKKHNLDIIGIRIKEGDKKDYNDLHDFVKDHDLSIAKNYEEVKSRIDLDNYIDYMILEIYSNNNDWPSNNFRVWRERKQGSKYRWILEDLDYGFVVVDRDKSAFERAKDEDVLITDLFKGLLENREFKTKFKNRFYTLLNTVFSPDNVLLLIQKLVNERREYFYNEPKRWDITIDDFDADVENLKNFAKNRLKIIKAQLDDL